jgi:hypothetical protein
MYTQKSRLEQLGTLRPRPFVLNLPATQSRQPHVYAWGMLAKLVQHGEAAGTSWIGRFSEPGMGRF